ncbi:peptidoglycan binding protein CsiV [Vibrio parahaemolyticus]|uniref:peptidoglycan binding protein CsiV n=1 Tax=Vibrio parahaemolyticus TaxID=670 RepID=UPI001C4F7D85|nr:peptidoglycan binding protein CsiV [Vibrio parahaemolyticus]MDL2010320.1 peptidoglycan binding protein CsiV [Vibrio parahaemolyticus]HCG6786686.1 peptidoglycan binding protein CsiV [Vibrio parahaemolyticus]HCH3849682.1 peptidoglycan binding protein CsiV [Vibrio parahaemolyticus]HCH3852844.1 peptidoglycan binding protein CsiV [Vibrio parahaemolyticus]HCM1414970.1 peptidoglycan binding protein CsiV [Vibrio parahaemolyticus]
MRILIPLLLLCVSMPSWAARQFDIEVIIFKRAVDAESTTESWPNQLPKIDMENVGSLDSETYRRSKGVTLLPRSSFRLNAQEAALNNHAGFKVLKHVAWRQSDRGKASAPIFRIVGGRDFSGSYNADGSPINGNNNYSSDGYNEETINGPLYELDGKFQIYVQHYLFAETTLDLREPSVREVRFESKSTDQLNDELGDVDDNVQVGNLAEISPTVTEETFLKSYRLDQKRRMKSSETHYLDNPLMGMIIQVRRVN